MNELAIRILDPEEGQFLRRIEWNCEEFEGWMQELSSRYAETAIVTADDYKASKADRAELNKVKKAIDARRIEVKKAVLEPYERFEKELSDATASIEKISGKIDKSIKAYETAEKEAKRKRIRNIFDNEIRQPFWEDVPASEMAFLEFDRVFDPKWLNASSKMAAIEKELNEKLGKIEEGIRAILTMDTDPALRASAMQEYKRTLDLGAALRLHGDLSAKAQREKEEQRRREAEAAERKRQQDMQALREKLSSEQSKTPVPPVQSDRPEAPVSGFSQQGQINPQAMRQNATQGQDGGKFGPPGAMDNGIRYSSAPPNARIDPYEGLPETGGVVPQGRPAAPVPPQMPAQVPPQQPKMMFTEFRVEGTREQLLALKDYMDRNGLRYGPVKK